MVDLSLIDGHLIGENADHPSNMGMLAIVENQIILPISPNFSSLGNHSIMLWASPKQGGRTPQPFVSPDEMENAIKNRPFKMVSPFKVVILGDGVSH